MLTLDIWIWSLQTFLYIFSIFRSLRTNQSPKVLKTILNAISVADHLQKHIPSDGMSRLCMKKLNRLDANLVTKILAQQPIFNFIIKETIKVIKFRFRFQTRKTISHFQIRNLVHWTKRLNILILPMNLLNKHNLPHQQKK